MMMRVMRRWWRRREEFRVQASGPDRRSGDLKPELIDSTLLLRRSPLSLFNSRLNLSRVGFSNRRAQITLRPLRCCSSLRGLRPSSLISNHGLPLLLLGSRVELFTSLRFTRSHSVPLFYHHPLLLLPCLSLLAHGFLLSAPDASLLSNL